MASDADRWLPFTDAELRLLAAALRRHADGPRRTRPERCAMRAMLDQIADERSGVRLSASTMAGIRVQQRATSRSKPALQRAIARYLERWPSMPYSGHATEITRNPDGRWWTVLSHDPKGS